MQSIRTRERKPKLTAQEIRILELAMDVCEKVAKQAGAWTDYFAHADHAKNILDSLRGFYGKSKPLAEEPD